MKVVPTLLADTATILLLSSSNKDLQMLTKTLSATGCNLKVVMNLAEAEQTIMAQNIDLLVVDYDQQTQTNQDDHGALDAFLQRFAHPPASHWVSGRTRILLLAGRRNREEMRHIFDLSFASNIVAKSNEFSPGELITTVGKIIRNDIFGIDKYLCYGATPTTYEVSSSLQKDPLLNAMSEYATNIGINKRIISAVAGVADELLMNAIYNAPIYPNGVRPYARQSRTIPVELQPNETCFFSFASDGTNFLISVHDRFGSLTPEKIRGYLVRCFSMGDDQIEQKQGGAGIGFYFIMENLNKLIVNISPGRGTEFIGIIDISGTYRDYIERCKSFHIFVG